MGFELEIFNDAELEADFIDWLVERKAIENQNRFSRLWDYYTNRMAETSGRSGLEGKMNESGRPYVQAQEYGLPSRITGLMRLPETGIFGGRAVKDIQRKEVVIENDIAWRVNAAVDFLFGKPVSFVSRSPDGQKRSEIGLLLKALFGANGGIGFFQDMAVLGGVYGFVDCLIRPGEKIHNFFTSPSSQLPLEDMQQLTRTIELELIEAPRALPVLDEDDYRKIIYYVQHLQQKKNSISGRNSFLSRLFFRSRQKEDPRQTVSITEIISSQAWQRYEDKELVAEGELPWGFLPVVHIQNIAQPYFYEGLSDVEPLIPLQDELNTRLSDRASRITFQSFKMYLGKGIEGFENKPVSPGRMWYTDNMEATIEEFGGDASTPSEDLHIAEIREALDKTSGVAPVVVGVLKNKLGNLTSAVALRLVLMGMLSRNERKQFTYSEGLKTIAKMVLGILDTANIYKTNEADREVEIIFANPLPEDVLERLKEAQIKKELGVPTEQVLRELGYETTNNRGDANAD